MLHAGADQRVLRLTAVITWRGTNGSLSCCIFHHCERLQLAREQRARGHLSAKVRLEAALTHPKRQASKFVRQEKDVV